MVVAALLFKLVRIALEKLTVGYGVVKLKGVAVICERKGQRGRYDSCWAWLAEKVAEGLYDHVVGVDLAVS